MVPCSYLWETLSYVYRYEWDTPAVFSCGILSRRCAPPKAITLSASMSPPLELLPPRPVADRTRPASANQKNFGQIVSPRLTDIQGPAAKAEPPCLGGVTRTPPRHANGVGRNGRVVGLGATNGPLHCVAGIHRHCLVRRSFGRAVANLHSWEPMT